MISFLVDKDVPEDITIIADEQGIDELISYLEGIKKDKDHMHLIIDTELDPYPLPKEVKNKVFFTKHVRLEYKPTQTWDAGGNIS